jgi:hypothetical protein
MHEPACYVPEGACLNVQRFEGRLSKGNVQPLAFLVVQS